MTPDQSPETQGPDQDPHPDPRVWIEQQGLTTTEDVAVPDRLIDQVIGQDEAVEVATKAAEQGRNLLLIGDPGTGKSMIAKAMTEVLPPVTKDDVLVSTNDQDPNAPKVHTVEGGLGAKIKAKYERKANKRLLLYRAFEWTVGLGTVVFGLLLWLVLDEGILAFLFSVLIAILFLYFTSQNRPNREALVPKLLFEHSDEPEPAPYVDATGSHAGALLGDVRHDPYQSGGLETAAHHRVEAGAIHRAHKGILFIDEINVLRLQSQQALLTAMQDKEYSIVGQSESSSGAMIRTEPMPCDFILVAAGNLDAVQLPDPISGTGMHPALRSRIRGYGYEVYVNNRMEDTDRNREKLIQFVAQEVERDGKIPHFDAGAVAAVIREAQRRSGRNGKLTLRLRELGGLVRTAGDHADTLGDDVVTAEHVAQAKRSARSLEQQIMEREIEAGESTEAASAPDQATVGTTYGVGIVDTSEGEVAEPAGMVIPVEAAVVPALHRHGGDIVLGTGLKGASGSRVENVGAVVKALKGSDIADHDLHVDATVHHEEAELEGIGLAAAVATISSLEDVPVDPTVALVGEVTVTGRLKPVPATLQRIEAAVARGLTTVVIPEPLRGTIILEGPAAQRADLIYGSHLADILPHVLVTSEDDRGEIAQRLQAGANGKSTTTATSETDGA